jgi:hypothetical protein
MNEETMSKALEAIHEIAESIRGGDLPDDLADQIDLIAAIARAKADVRNAPELLDVPTEPAGGEERYE